MYHVESQGIDECMINIQYYYIILLLWWGMEVLNMNIYGLPAFH